MMDEYDELYERERYEREQLMAAKIGPSFGHRRLPRVRVVAGSRWWWKDRAGPYRTEKKARRVARHLRDTEGKGETYGVYSLPPLKGRRLRRWFVAYMDRR